jgi:hypothetical protein
MSEVALWTRNRSNNIVIFSAYKMTSEEESRLRADFNSFVNEANPQVETYKCCIDGKIGNVTIKFDEVVQIGWS